MMSMGILMPLPRGDLPVCSVTVFADAVLSCVERVPAIALDWRKSSTWTGSSPLYRQTWRCSRSIVEPYVLPASGTSRIVERSLPAA